MLLTTLLTPLAATASPAPGAPAEKSSTTKPALSARELFDRGKQLVEDNCDECMTSGNSQNELREAVDMLKQALRRGYTDKAAIHRLLRTAYGSLGMRQLSHSELLAVIKTDPNDLDARTDWIETLPAADQIAELRKITAKAPNYSMAHYLLAVTFFGHRNLPDGTKSIRRWLDTGSPAEIADLSFLVFGSLRVEDLKKVLRADPTIYPAHTVIALQLVGRRDGTDDVQGAVTHARLALAAAPSAVALRYEYAIDQVLRNNSHDKEADALRRKFAAKLKFAEDHYQDH